MAEPSYAWGRPLKWVSKSPAKLAEGLRAYGHEVSPNTVAKLLEEELDYSRQVARKLASEVNRKTHEGSSHPDRNTQFEHINTNPVRRLQNGLTATGPRIKSP